MNSSQLQLDLWQELKEAEQAPEQCDLERLCNGLEAVIAATPPAQQLQTAATAFLQIAEIFALRAEVLLSDWEQTYSDEGPALEEDDLSELLRQSMCLVLDELVAESEPYYSRQSPSNTPSVESIAAPVDKVALLEAFDSEIELVETEAQATSATMALAEAEDVVGWAKAIAHYLQQQKVSSVSLTQLQQTLPLSLVEIWLGLLLGGYSLRKELATPQFAQQCQAEEFYGAEVWVDCLT